MVSAEEVLINLVGRDQLSGPMNKGAASFRNLQKEAGAAKVSVDRVGAGKASMDKLSGSTLGAAEKVKQLANHAQGAQGELNKIAGAGASVNKVGDSASNAGKKLDSMGAAGSKAGASSAAGMNKATSAAEGLSGMIGQVISGFGLMSIASSAATGAMSKEMNQALLTRRYGAEQAKALTGQIQQIVADVPGDDTYMNQMLNLASYKTGLTDTNTLKELGTTIADYTIGGQVVAGQRPWESQMELKDYILNGNTALMARDGILKNHIDKLEKAKTVEERIKALNEALNEEGLKGISTLETTATTWETVKGKIQLALTALGEKFLPTASKILDIFLQLDESTGGWSTELIVIGGTVAAIAGSIGLISGPIKNGIGLFKDMKDGAVGVLEKIGLINSTPCTPKKCVQDVVTRCGVSGGTGGVPGNISGGVSPHSGAISLMSMMSKVGQGVTIGLTVGDALSNWVVGPAFSGISSILGGGKPYKAYHGILDLVGLGNTDYQVLSNDDQVRKRAIAEGSITPEKIKQNLSDWGPFDPKNWPKLPEGITSPFPKLPSGQDLLGWLPKIGKGIAGWGGILGALGSKLPTGGLLDALLPGTAHAAGSGGGKPSFQKDIESMLKRGFGKGSWFDLSKQKWKLPSITPVINFFKRIPNQARQFLGKLPGVATSTFNSMVNNAKEGAGRVVSGVITTVSQLPGAVYNEFMRIGQSILSAGGALWNYAYQTGLNILNGLKSALGIASPGLMYKMVRGELANIHGIMGEYQSTLGMSSTGIGQAVLRNFNMIQRAPSTRAAQIRTGSMGETHIHQHGEQISIDASHMSGDELKSLLYDVLSGMNKTTIPNVRFG